MQTREPPASSSSGELLSDLGLWPLAHSRRIRRMGSMRKVVLGAFTLLAAACGGGGGGGSGNQAPAPNPTPTPAPNPPTNTVPVAAIGLDQTALLGATVSVFGGRSSDAEGAPLTFNWALTERLPETSRYRPRGS